MGKKIEEILACHWPDSRNTGFLLAETAEFLKIQKNQATKFGYYYCTVIGITTLNTNPVYTGLVFRVVILNTAQ